MTFKEVKDKLRSIPKERQAAVVCALVGHSRIVSACFGYITCERCGEQIADKLGGSGYAQAKTCVQVGHNCTTCQRNYKRITWRDKFLVPNPFGGKRDDNTKR